MCSAPVSYLSAFQTPELVSSHLVALIAVRIWLIRRSVAPLTSRNAGTSVMSIILESAAIYTLTLVALIVTSTLGSSVMLVFLNLITPLMVQYN